MENLVQLPAAVARGAAVMFRGKNMKTTLRLWVLAFVCLGAWSAYAQEVSAGITGRVTDPSGGSIVGAKVMAKDVDRGTEWPTTTNDEGIYAFPRVPVGRYTLRVEASGFKSAVQSDITLEINQRARIDIALQVGGVARR